MTPPTSPIRWGIIGPGTIALDFRDGLGESSTGRLSAIAPRDPQRPGLAKSFPGARILDGYQAMLDDPDIDAVYIATLHPNHAEWAIKAAKAGKHVLVEKPVTLNAREAGAVFDAHSKAGTFVGEAFMYRLHPITAKLGSLIRSGAIGEVRTIQSSFGFQMPTYDPTHRTFANALGGGGILDVGGYTVSMSRFIAGAAADKPFLNPTRLQGAAHLGQERTDEWAAATLEFENGILAQVSCAVRAKLDNLLRITGATGWIEVQDFWFAGGDGRRGGLGRIDIVRPSGESVTIEIGETPHLFSFEIDAVATALRERHQQFNAPGMTWEDSMGNMRALDKWRADCGLVYDIESRKH